MLDKRQIRVEIILTIIGLLMILGLIALIIIMLVKKPKKRSEKKVEDIPLTSLESFDFIDDKTIPEYPHSNLGFTGKLILDCYIGTCTEEIFHKQTRTVCNYDDDCKEVDESWTEYKKIIDYDCSEQCMKEGGEGCYCSKPYNNRGTCERKTDDDYEEGKICYGDNIIYFWKGKKYKILKSLNLTYLDNVFLKNESCPSGTKYCGIIDNEEKKLCIKSNLNCPINYISENKENNDYSSVLIGNKTFYYGYDDNKSNRKIIARLGADTDLYLNDDKTENVIIDTYTISGFLEDNKNLYKGIDLGYDPYNTKDIDNKGKSYLRAYINENVDLNKHRQEKDNQILAHNLNENALNYINSKTKTISILGFISLGYILLVFLIFLYFQVEYYKKGWNSGKKCYYAIPIIIFIALIIAPLIFGCININKANKAEEIDSKTSYTAFKVVNIIFVVIGFTFIAFLILYIILIPIHCRCLNEIEKTQRNEKTVTVANESNINDQINKTIENSGLDINKNK